MDLPAREAAQAQLTAGKWREVAEQLKCLLDLAWTDGSAVHHMVKNGMRLSSKSWKTVAGGHAAIRSRSA